MFKVAALAAIAAVADAALFEVRIGGSKKLDILPSNYYTCRKWSVHDDKAIKGKPTKVNPFLKNAAVILSQVPDD